MRTLVESNSVDESLSDRVYKVLNARLSKVVDAKDSKIVLLPLVIVKKVLVDLASSTLVFGFMGRIPSKLDLLSWLASLDIFGRLDMVDFLHHLSIGFYTVIF